jgi:hypothetical protein
MTKRKSKQELREASHAPEATKANKAAIIVLLAGGMSPGEAAETQKVGRSTLYDWKKDDLQFAAQWENAVQTSFDKVEGRLYSIAMRGEDSVARAACMDILKHRRSDQWHISNNGDRVSGSQTNYFLNMPMQEHIERLERLGLPVPVIESDREEDYAPDTEEETDSP